VAEAKILRTGNRDWRSTRTWRIHAEATTRREAFDRSKLGPVRTIPPLEVSTGQLAHEWGHLQRKLAMRLRCSHAGTTWCPATCVPDVPPAVPAAPGPVGLLGAHE
jgi:hypothetical protein